MAALRASAQTNRSQVKRINRGLCGASCQPVVSEESMGAESTTQRAPGTANMLKFVRVSRGHRIWIGRPVRHLVISRLQRFWKDFRKPARSAPGSFRPSNPLSPSLTFSPTKVGPNDLVSLPKPCPLTVWTRADYTEIASVNNTNLTQKSKKLLGLAFSPLTSESRASCLT
jgi:hypothetical protein